MTSELAQDGERGKKPALEHDRNPRQNHVILIFMERNGEDKRIDPTLPVELAVAREGRQSFPECFPMG